MKSTLGQERIIDEEKMKIHLNEYKNDYFSESIKSEFTKETSNEDATDNKIAVSIEYQIKVEESAQIFTNGEYFEADIKEKYEPTTAEYFEADIKEKYEPSTSEYFEAVIKEKYEPITTEYFEADIKVENEPSIVEYFEEDLNMECEQNLNVETANNNCQFEFLTNNSSANIHMKHQIALNYQIKIENSMNDYVQTNENMNLTGFNLSNGMKIKKVRQLNIIDLINKMKKKDNSKIVNNKVLKSKKTNKMKRRSIRIQNRETSKANLLKLKFDIKKEASVKLMNLKLNSYRGFL